MINIIVLKILHKRFGTLSCDPPGQSALDLLHQILLTNEKSEIKFQLISAQLCAPPGKLKNGGQHTDSFVSDQSVKQQDFTGIKWIFSELQGRECRKGLFVCLLVHTRVFKKVLQKFLT